MKIVHVVESFGGGVYTYLKDLSHFLSKQPSIAVTIIYSNKRHAITKEQITRDFSGNIEMICIPMERELNLVRDIQTTLQLKRLFSTIKPDVIHLHSSKAGVLGRSASFFAKGKNNVFYTPHGYSFLREDVSVAKRKFYRFAERITQKVFGGTTVACGDTEHTIAKSIGKSVLVRNGIDVDKLHNYYIPKQANGEQLTIGTTGRITFQKNPSLFNEIALSLPQHQFVWIGDGGNRDILTAPNIRITGWLTNEEDIVAHLNQLDLYIQTSLWEGLPIAILEAMALCKPIIATCVIGNMDIVKHGHNGFLFTTVEEAKQQISQLKDEALLQLLGNNAYSTCLATYNMEANFELLLEIYKGNKCSPLPYCDVFLLANEIIRNSEKPNI